MSAAGLARSIIEQPRARDRARLVLAGVCSRLPPPLIASSGHSLLAGFAALFLLLWAWQR